MTTLEDRVRALEDEKSIVRTLRQYASAEDRVDPAAFADAFTEDGVWWSSIDGPWAGTGGSRHEGREDLMRWHAGITDVWGPEPRARTKHYLIGPDIRLDGDHATAESYLLSVAASPDGPKVVSMGRYLDRLVRCSDGRWRIQERHLAREGAGVEAMKRPTR